MNGVTTVAAFQRVKQEDGTYTIVLPYNTPDEVLYDPNTGFTLTTKLHNIDTIVNANRDSVIEDLITLTCQLSSFISKPLQLNHVYIDDFRTIDGINLASGGFINGKLFI